MNIDVRPTRLPDVLELVIEPHSDDRGWIGEAFEVHRFGELGLPTAWAAIKFVESSHGVLRGMHWQRAPREQAKLVACHHGEVFDVAVDVRPESPTFRQWVGVYLSPDRRNMIYVPRGFAHGMMTISSDDSRCSYAVAFSSHAPDCAAGFRWDDPAVGVGWPDGPVITSARDAAWERLS